MEGDKNMTKQEIAKQRGYDLTSTEIDVLCYVWMNTPKWECSEEEEYVNLGVGPTEDNPFPFSRISDALLLDDGGLLKQHEQDCNRFRLTETGEKLIEDFYR